MFIIIFVPSHESRQTKWLRYFVKYTKMALQAYLWQADTEVNTSLCRDNTLASPNPEKRHWDFPNLEIPEAPLHHGGAPLGSTLSRDPRGSSTSRRRITWTYPTWGSTTNSCACKKLPRICPSVSAIHNTSSRSDKSTYICSIPCSVYSASYCEGGLVLYETNVFEFEIKSEEAFTSGTDSSWRIAWYRKFEANYQVFSPWRLAWDAHILPVSTPQPPRYRMTRILQWKSDYWRFTILFIHKE